MCCRIPDGICRRYGGTFDCTCRRGVYIALGLFTIVQIVRNVQMLIPTYDFCIPEKECTGSTSDSPCDMFSRIDFPTDEFFPPKASVDSICDGHCSCSSCSSCLFLLRQPGLFRRFPHKLRKIKFLAGRAVHGVACFRQSGAPVFDCSPKLICFGLHLF